MGRIYNEVAGRSLERLASLTDAIFAFAMTLLVLDIRVPDVNGIHTETQLGHALLALSPRLLTCVMTFLTLGVFWVGHQTHLGMLKRSDRNLTWIHIGFMFAVVLTPFSTALLASFIDFRVAIFFYWLNILLLGAMLFASYKYAFSHGLLDDGAPVGLDVVERRIVVAQGLYFAAALVCLVNTRLSIALLFLIQANYAIAPRFLPWLYRV